MGFSAEVWLGAPLSSPKARPLPPPATAAEKEQTNNTTNSATTKKTPSQHHHTTPRPTRVAEGQGKTKMQPARSTKANPKRARKHSQKAAKPTEAHHAEATIESSSPEVTKAARAAKAAPRQRMHCS